jgi:hypothetical protein
MSVVSVAFALLVVATVLLLYRWLTPRGWRQVGLTR